MHDSEHQNDGEKPSPRVVFIGQKDGPWDVHLMAPDEIANRVGANTLAAFFKCFIGVDRVLAFEQLLLFSQRQLKTDSPAGVRNRMILFMLMVATLHELGAALQQLCNSQVIKKMDDKSVWAPLNDLRAKWYSRSLSARLRNQLGHHLGDVQLHQEGLAHLLEQEDVLLFSAGHSRRHGGSFVGAWDALFSGLDLDEVKYQEIAQETWKSHINLPDQLIAVFSEVLKTAGITVESQLREHRQEGRRSARLRRKRKSKR